MNSDLIPSSESPNAAGSKQSQTGEQAATRLFSSPNSTETASNGTTANRHQPIPPPSEPMQYRAIGLVHGRYSPSAEQLTQGTLIATEGTELNAVLLGRIISLLKNHLDLEQEHLWVVYPRIGQQDDNLHLQIVGVWEPDKLAREQTPDELGVVEAGSSAPSVGESKFSINSPVQEPIENPSPEIEDGYFSIRGEVVYQSAPDKNFIVKIKQSARKESDKPKYFKLKIQGDLQTKAVGQFWDFQARRQGNGLVLEKGEAIAVLPSKPKLRKNKPPQGRSSNKRNLGTPSPVRKAGDRTSGVLPPTPKSPTPKPIKRQRPPQQ